MGTTSVRVLETVFGEPPGSLEGRNELFITPGFEFRAAGALNGSRLSRWRGLETGTEPLLWILHVGYAWLVVGLVLLGTA